MSHLERAEKLVSQWELEGQHTGVSELQFYYDTLEEEGYSQDEASEIVSEIDVEDFGESDTYLLGC